MVGLALGNLFVGPLSDSLGRKPLLITMALFTIASVAIVFTTNIGVMISAFRTRVLWRSWAVISRAISSDLYSGKQLTKFLAILMLLMSGTCISTCTWWHRVNICYMAYDIYHLNSLWLSYVRRDSVLY